MLDITWATPEVVRNFKSFTLVMLRGLCGGGASNSTQVYQELSGSVPNLLYLLVLLSVLMMC